MAVFCLREHFTISYNKGGFSKPMDNSARSFNIGRFIRPIGPTPGNQHVPDGPPGASVLPRIPTTPLRWLGIATMLIPLEVLGAGASTPFTTLEAEDGTSAGGATATVIASNSVLPTGNTPEKEASGLGQVKERLLKRSGDVLFRWRTRLPGCWRWIATFGSGQRVNFNR